MHLVEHIYNCLKNKKHHQYASELQDIYQISARGEFL